MYSLKINVFIKKTISLANTPHKNSSFIQIFIILHNRLWDLIKQ